MGTNWSIGSSDWIWGRTSSLWGWRSTGTGCPGRLWSLPLRRYSRPAWMQSCAACSRWPCFSRGVRLDAPQRSLPTPTIPWFCDSSRNHSLFTLFHATPNFMLTKSVKSILSHISPDRSTVFNYPSSRSHSLSPILPSPFSAYFRVILGFLRWEAPEVYTTFKCLIFETSMPFRGGSWAKYNRTEASKNHLCV